MAINFPNIINQNTHYKNFDVYIPKTDLILNDNNNSNILKNLNNMIKLNPKPPKLKGGIPVLKFGGKVKMESIKNFILINLNQPENQIFTFGKVSENHFIGELTYPLSPIQALSICLTHF